MLIPIVDLQIVMVSLWFEARLLHCYRTPEYGIETNTQKLYKLSQNLLFGLL